MIKKTKIGFFTHCATCDKPLEPTRFAFCSAKCGNIMYRRPNKVCLCCGNKLGYHSTKFCNNACRMRYRYIQEYPDTSLERCLVCNTKLSTQLRYCDRRCKNSTKAKEFRAMIRDVRLGNPKLSINQAYVQLIREGKIKAKFRQDKVNKKIARNMKIQQDRWDRYDKRIEEILADEAISERAEDKLARIWLDNLKKGKV